MLNSCYFKIRTKRSPVGKTGKIVKQKQPLRLHVPLQCRRFTQNVADG